MFSWVAKSMKNKAVIVLILFGIVPLMVFGITTNIVATRILENRLRSMAEQTIDKLAVSISKDFQGFLDLAFYHSTNNKIGELLRLPLETDEQKKYVFYSIMSEMKKNSAVRRINYPFHYIVISKSGIIFTNFTYSSNDIYTGMYNQLNEEDWYGTIKNAYSHQLWMGIRRHYFLPRSQNQIYVAGSIIDDLENVGVVMLGIDDYYISKLLANVRISERSSLYVADSTGRYLVEGERNYYHFDSLPQSFIPDVLKNEDSSFVTDILGKEQMVIHNDLYLKGMNTTWKVIMITPVEDIHSDINTMNYITIVLISISLIAVLLLILLINNDIINPIIRLSRNIKEVQHGNLEVKAEEDRSDEIGQLGYGFNAMVHNIKRYIRNIQEEEKTKRELEVRMLQSQINPHFVRNTLNIIRWMAEMMKVPGISHAIASFTKLLDYSFKNLDVLVTVSEEKKYLEEYIYLQKLRYQNKFCSTIDIDSDIMDCKVLRLTFQPVVENSIMHGLERKKGLGNLHIRGYREDDTLVFIIKDDGVGMDRETLIGLFEEDASEKDSGNYGKIGLVNVRQRIKLNYGEDYDLSISSAPGEGTEVKIIIPVIK